MFVLIFLKLFHLSLGFRPARFVGLIVKLTILLKTEGGWFGGEPLVDEFIAQPPAHRFWVIDTDQRLGITSFCEARHRF
jgi:hypothetical protein